MWEVAFGVVLTAAIGGLLVPLVKGHIDQRREQFKLAGELLETLATSLRTLEAGVADRVLRGKGSGLQRGLRAALEAWDSDKAWDNGAQIQIRSAGPSGPACLRTLMRIWTARSGRSLRSWTRKLRTFGRWRTRPRGTSTTSSCIDPGAMRSRAAVLVDGAPCPGAAGMADPAVAKV